jgi:hypothetical protein
MDNSTVQIFILDRHSFWRSFLLSSFLFLVLFLLGPVALFEQSLGDFEHNFGVFVWKNVFFLYFNFDMWSLRAGDGAASARLFDLLSGATDHYTFIRTGIQINFHNHFYGGILFSYFVRKF